VVTIAGAVVALQERERKSIYAGAEGGVPMADWTCRRTLCRVALVVVVIAAGLPAAAVSAAQMKLSGSLVLGTEVVGFSDQP